MDTNDSPTPDAENELASLRRQVAELRTALDLELNRAAAAGEALNRASLELEWLMGRMTDAYVVWDAVPGPDGGLADIRFVFFNDAYQRISGLRLDDVRGRSVREVWPDTEQSWFDVYGEVLRTGVQRTFEMYHAPTSGWYACKAYRPSTMPNRVCVVFEDITEKRRAARQIEDLAHLQRTILDTVWMGISYVKDRKQQWVNHAFADMFGYATEEMPGLDTATFYGDRADYERVGRDGYRTIAEGRTYSTEARMKRKDGSLFWCSITGQALDPDDLGAGSIWVLADITARREAAAALRASEERFRRLIENSSDIILVLDADGALKQANGPVAAVTGYASTDLIGRPVLEAIHPEDRAAASALLGEAARTPGKPQRGVFRVRHKDGHWLFAEMVGTSLIDEPSVNGLVLNVRDISERKNAEEQRLRLLDQLQQALKMEAVGRLAGGVAHDFNNLLTTISGNLELARMDVPPNHPVAQNLDEIRAATDRATALTRQLLAFSRRQIIEPRVLDLNGLVRNLEKMLVRLIGEDVVLESVLARDLYPVKVDPGQFEQVLVNLAVNARDAMPNGGRLLIETTNAILDEAYCARHGEVRPGAYVLMAVSDTGHGMSEQVRQRLFEPFFTTKPTGRGTGLGLATAFGTVKQAGGTIEVYSEVGLGSTFKIYLPRAEGAPKDLAPAAEPAAPVGGAETVLVVEDETSVRELAISMLRRLGYDVLHASHPAEALARAAEHPGRIDLLMTDVVMPGMNGRELATRLLEIHPETRVLYTSGYTENVIVHHGVVEENIQFIGKPYSMPGLASKIREILGGNAG